MRKFAYLIASVVTMAIAIPSIATAETTVIKTRGHDHGPRAEMRMHRDHGWHRGHDKKVAIIKHGRHRHDRN
jgi:hypothetical protein